MLNIIDARGNEKSFKSAIGIKANTNFGIQKSLYQSGKDLKATFNRQVLAKDKTGTVYIRRNKAGARRRHQASAEGESPANRTGNYRRSTGFYVNGGNELVFGNAAKYGGFLELGTSRMKPRPGLGNAVNANERNLIRNFATEIQDAI